MRTFIRTLWGTPDTCYDEGWVNASSRRTRLDDDIEMILKHPNTVPFITYVLGKKNYDYLKSLGVKDVVLLGKEPVLYNPQTEFWRHKLDILKAAMVDHDEIVYLDWDCIPVKPLFNDFWERLGKKREIQCNLQFYRRRKCLWRTVDLRKTCNGGFLYIRGKDIPQKLIDTWNNFNADCKFWDETAISKLTDDMSGGWQGIDYYWNNFEPTVCNLTDSKNRSAFTDEQIASKDICFMHYIQDKIRRKKIHEESHN